MLKSLVLKMSGPASGASRLSDSASTPTFAEGGGRKSAGDALRVDDLIVDYGSTRVVKSVSFSVAQGEFVTLLGPSGSGKTSVLRAVAGYVKPVSGAIRIRGKNIVSHSPRARNCGMVFQNYALFPHMTVFQNIAYGLKTRRVNEQERRQRVEQIVETMGLGGFEHRHPREMSGGQQQRVALARALVIRPDILLMDEPLAALDLRLREQMQVEIRRIQQKFNISTLYITHDQGEAFTMSDRIMVMNKGEILSNARPRQIYLKPNCSFTATFVGSSALLEIPLEDARAANIRLPGHEGQLRLNKPVARDAARIVAALRPEVVEIADEAKQGWSRGVVASRRYVGMSLVVTIGVADHEILSVDATGTLEVGDAVWFRWAPRDVHVIVEDASGKPCGGEGAALEQRAADSSGQDVAEGARVRHE